jgi:5-methylcytosine-specific restriction enzyme subunit McrC
MNDIKLKEIEIPEYTSRDLDVLNEKVDLPYLKKPCFYSENKPPYKITAIRDNNIRIENTSYSGIIQLDKARIQFSTKVKTNLFYMLTFLRDENNFYYDPDMVIDLKEGANFFDILGRLFLNELDEIFRRGFYKKYVGREENISFLRGKILINKNIDNLVRKKAKFYCAYKDLTYDNPENRIILKASTLLVPLIRFNEMIKKDLQKYNNILKETVSLVSMLPEDCSRIHFNRLNEHYKTIIQFSKVILQNYFIRSTRIGGSKGFNFIVNMNKVYENFITTLTEEVISENKEFADYSVESQERFNSLVKEKKIINRPDIIIKKKDSRDNYPVIIDCKYKRESNNSDYYQVVCYGLAIPSAKSCCLIYPDSETIEKNELTLDAGLFNNQRGDVKIYSKKINLYIDDNLDFNSYIRIIKSELKQELLDIF